MIELYAPMLASLPLLLWKTPPGLELILAQEGVAFETVFRIETLAPVVGLMGTDEL